MVVLPQLTLNDPDSLAAEVSLAMSPLIGTDSNTSFEFDRSSGRPGTASSTGNDDGKSGHVKTLSIWLPRAEAALSLSRALPTCATSNARDCSRACESS